MISTRNSVINSKKIWPVKMFSMKKQKKNHKIKWIWRYQRLDWMIFEIWMKGSRKKTGATYRFFTYNSCCLKIWALLQLYWNEKTLACWRMAQPKYTWFMIWLFWYFIQNLKVNFFCLWSVISAIAKTKSILALMCGKVKHGTFHKQKKIINVYAQYPLNFIHKSL